MLNLLWELHQNNRIEDAKSAARGGHDAAERVLDKLQKLEERVDALTLTNLAVWTLLRETTGLTDAQLEARVREIDLSDGQLDGKVSLGVWNCPACERPNSPKQSKCLYCGAGRGNKSLFPV